MVPVAWTNGRAGSRSGFVRVGRCAPRQDAVTRSSSSGLSRSAASAGFGLGWIVFASAMLLLLTGAAETRAGCGDYGTHRWDDWSSRAAATRLVKHTDKLASRGAMGEVARRRGDVIRNDVVPYDVLPSDVRPRDTRPNQRGPARCESQVPESGLPTPVIPNFGNGGDVRALVPGVIAGVDGWTARRFVPMESSLASEPDRVAIDRPPRV